ncbi:RNA-directed DNA polymerase [Gossypium australe]|uniref:RNA-directed DNA polymerase n=1 Tax=Gossypium australe TaxID=47621 RepID=A0A5B6VQF0_9ROSI|nr:RNA-directed DNA polymerase [Gossypium australe]
MNGAVEATFKKTKIKLAGEITIYAYRTSVRTSTGATLFSLIYGTEIPSIRILSELKLDEAKWIQSRYDQLNLIEEKRLRAIHHGGFGIKEDSSHTKGLQREMNAKLGMTLCGKEGLFWRSIDFN